MNKDYLSNNLKIAYEINLSNEYKKAGKCATIFLQEIQNRQK